MEYFGFYENTMMYVIGFIVSFIMVFLEGFQHQNVLGGHYKAAFIVSYCRAIADVGVISLVVTQGYDMVIPMGTGAAIGITLSMWAHKKIFIK